MGLPGGVSAPPCALHHPPKPRDCGHEACCPQLGPPRPGSLKASLSLIQTDGRLSFERAAEKEKLAFG